MTALAKNIKRLRDIKGWTQEDLEAAAGLSSVAMIESGERRSPRSGTLQKIAKALGVEIADLYRDDDAPPAHESLDHFLTSPLAADVTAKEREELRKVQWPFGRPSIKAWFHLLEAMRATRQD